MHVLVALDLRHHHCVVVVVCHRQNLFHRVLREGVNLPGHLVVDAGADGPAIVIRLSIDADYRSCHERLSGLTGGLANLCAYRHQHPSLHGCRWCPLVDR